VAGGEVEFSNPINAGLPLDDLARSLPELPGVYRFLDGAGRPVYVGKAKDLRKRVLQHLSDRPDRRDRMLEQAADIDFTVTPNESSALLLERNLIRRFQPKFNVTYKDDKDYPYIIVTKDDFPRVHLSRDKRPDGHTFGPFASAAYARQTIGFVRKHFQIRDCPEFIKGGCLSYHIKLCTAPCIEKATKEEYGEQVRQAITFLRGTPPLSATWRDQTISRVWQGGLASQPWRRVGFNVSGNFVRTTGAGEISGEPPTFGPMTWPLITATAYYDFPQAGRLSIDLQRTYYLEELVHGNDFQANLLTLRWTKDF